MRVTNGFQLLSVLLASLLFASANAQNYQATVLSLNPDHYWQLNETEYGTAVDSVGGLDGTHAGDLGAPDASGFGPGLTTDGEGEALIGLGADNRSFWAENVTSIDLGPGTALANTTMTYAGWFATNGSQGGDRLWTNNQSDPNTSFQIAFGGGFGDQAASLVIGLNPGMNGFLDNLDADGLPAGSNIGNFHIADSLTPTKDGEWHHIVASRNGNNIEDVIVVIDGVHHDRDTWSNSTDTWGTTGSNAHIATRTPGDGGGAQQVLNGRTDEVAIWLGRQLTVAESIALYDSAFTDMMAGPMCDSDGDGDCDLVDIDAMYDAFGSAGDFDFDGNGTVGPEDIGDWLSAASISGGDLNFQDGVDSSDLGLLLNNFGETGATAGEGPGYGGGDINGDATVDSTDLGLMLNNFGAAASASAVPEPGAGLLSLMAVVAMLGLSRRRK